MTPASTCRGSIRLPNGNLSPAAFSPVPRSAAAAALQVPTGSALLLPLKEPQLHFNLLWEHELPPGPARPHDLCLTTFTPQPLTYSRCMQTPRL